MWVTVATEDGDMEEMVEGEEEDLSLEMEEKTVHFTWFLVPGGFWWVLVGPGGFWWVPGGYLVGSGGFLVGTWWIPGGFLVGSW